jgi:cysteine desulfurase
MLANNETGVIFPLAEVSRIAKERGVLVHTDAVNAAGKMPIDVGALSVDLLSLSSHKIYGPMGVGALYIRRGTPFRQLIIGGPQERQRRGGTLNAPGIIGFGMACQILTDDGAAERERVAKLRERLEAELTRRFKGVQVLGCDTQRLPNTSCVCFPGVAAEPLLISLSEAGICVSTGSACSSGSLDPSHVLGAMGIAPEIAQGQVRFSLGRFNTEQDLERLFELLPRIIEKVTAANLG